MESKTKKKKGFKHWAMFLLRWGVAVVAVYLVVSNMSIRDQAWVILDHNTNVPQKVALEYHVDEDAQTFPVIDPTTDHVISLPRSDVLNEPDQKTVREINGPVVKLLAVDLAEDVNHNEDVAVRLLVEDPKTKHGVWIYPTDVVPKYQVRVPHPRDQVGLESMVRQAKPWLLWASFLVFPITFLITSYRWNELLKALDIHIGQGRTFVLNMVGCFYNTAVPAGSTGGDLLKAYYASKQTPFRMRAVMSVIVDRAVGLLALIFVGGVAAGTQWNIHACKMVAVAAIAICFCVLVGLLIFYNPTLHRLSGLDFILRKLPMQKHVRSAVDAMQMYGKHPLLGLWALIVSVPVHGSVVTSAMFAGMAFGLPLSWSYYWVCVPVIVLAGAIPISPQGAGVMEGFAVLLTRGRGVTVSQAFALTMSIRLVQMIWNLAGGIFVIRGGFHAPSEKEAEELKKEEAVSPLS